MKLEIAIQACRNIRQSIGATPRPCRDEGDIDEMGLCLEMWAKLNVWSASASLAREARKGVSQNSGPENVLKLL